MNLNNFQFATFSSFFLLFSVASYWFSLSFPKQKFFFDTGKACIILSNFFFFLTLFLRWLQNGYFPLSNLYESLIFLAWCLSFLHLFIENQTQSRLLGSLSAPLLFFLSGFASFSLPLEMQKALPLVPSLQSNWLMLHVSMMMISYATLLGGSLLSLFYVALSYFLVSPVSFSQGKSFSSLTSFSIPSFSLLERIDLWSYRIIGLGFPFLTIGIISGAVWANEAWGSYWSWDPKETWALITWLLFASYLHARFLQGWQGKKAAILGSTGFFLIWICYLGVNFLGKGLHTYGWVI